MPLDPDGKPWGRLVGEPNVWYGRFHVYLTLGLKRSYQEVYRQDFRRRFPGRAVPWVPGSWLDKAREWRWKERAEASDEHDRKQTTAALEEAKKEARQRRIAVLQGIAAKLAEALNRKGAVDEIRAIDAASLLVRVQAELRAEMDDEPKRRKIVSGDPENPIGHKIYLVDPTNPASPDDL